MLVVTILNGCSSMSLSAKEGSQLELTSNQDRTVFCITKSIVGVAKAFFLKTIYSGFTLDQRLRNLANLNVGPEDIFLPLVQQTQLGYIDARGILRQQALFVIWRQL